MIGMPTVIRINTDDNDDIFKTFPKRVNTRLSEHPYYAILTFNELNKVYSIKTISKILLTALDKIRLYKYLKKIIIIIIINTALIEKRLKAI
jgi:hypothetical protein